MTESTWQDIVDQTGKTKGSSINLQVELAPHHKSGLLLRNPVMTAAGTFGYGFEYAKIAAIQRLGAIVSKGTTLHARPGNPQPRTVETASGLLNAVGLQNPGIRVVVEKYAPLWSSWQTPVIVNIAGNSIEEFVELAERLEEVPGVAGIEVNISCPNIHKGDAFIGATPEMVAAVTTAVCHVTSLPLIIKLSPNIGDVRLTALAAASSGAALSLSSTLLLV